MSHHLHKIGVFIAAFGLMSISSTSAADTADPGITVGPEQTMINPAQPAGSARQILLGPSPVVDSLFTDHCWRASGARHCFGMMANNEPYRYTMNPKTGALSNADRVMKRGVVGSPKQCGIHPIGVIQQNPKYPDHLWTLFHAEQAWPGDNGYCNHVHDHTRFTIRRMTSRDNGLHWRDTGRVIGQDKSLLTDPATGVWNFACDDTGSPHMVAKPDGYLYLFYQACQTDNTDRTMSIARSRIGKNGVRGSWHKWYNGAWSQPGIGGKQTAIDGLPRSARGISWNRHLHRYIAVMVHIEGGYLFQSRGRNLMSWEPLATLWQTGLTGSVWHHDCDPKVGEPAAFGYGSPIGLHYEPGVSGKTFWVYYMHKPDGVCMDKRLLVRRQITVN